MNYIVLDLEWNQSPTGRVIKNKYGALPFEIIEIGAVKMDEDCKIISSFSRVIKPSVYLKLHKAVARLLPINMRDLLKGRGFIEVITDFLKWCGDDVIFCTWGEADLLQIQRNMRFHGMDIPFPFPFLYIDLQKIFSACHPCGKKNPSLSNAVDMLGLPKGSTFHRAINDAHYTALVAQHLDRERFKTDFSVDTFRIPEKESQEIRIVTRDTETYITRGYKRRETAASAYALRAGKCFLCGCTLKRRVRWFCDNGKNYNAAFTCLKHGYIAGKIRVRKTDKALYYAIRIMELTDKEGVDEIREKMVKEKERTKMKPEGKTDEVFRL